MTKPHTYTDTEVDKIVGDLMKKLPKGAHVTSRIDQGGSRVELDVGAGEKRQTFSYGLEPYKGKGKYGQVITRYKPAPPLDKTAVNKIVKWAKE